MKIAHSLLLLLALGLTHKTYTSERAKAVRKAFEGIAAKEAARCLQPGQGNRGICSRPPIQLQMAKEKQKAEAFKALIDPKARMLSNIRAKEVAAARAAGIASVGGSVVVMRSRIHARGPLRARL